MGLKACQGAEQGAFASPVGAEQGSECALWQCGVEVLANDGVAVAGGECVQCEHG